jgi:hypothetical protein
MKSNAAVLMFLRACAIAVCCGVLAIGNWPPSAAAQQISEQQAQAIANFAAQVVTNSGFEKHLDSDDRRLDAITPVVEGNASGIAVMQGKWDIVMGGLSILFVIFGGQIYLGWKRIKVE